MIVTISANLSRPLKFPNSLLGALTVSNSVISGNYASNGGGLFNSGTLVVANSTFINNTASFGGGIYSYKYECISVMTMSCNVFADNSATSEGGGLFNAGATSMRDVVFINNSAIDGGGIWSTSATVSDTSAAVSNSAFIGNTASGGGGGIDNDGGLTTSDSVFVGNSATYGGGIYNNIDDTVIAISNLFAYNSAAEGQGGGIFSLGGTLVNTGNIFFDNTGGDIYS